jgi:outer membrane protein, multidrug efflux system
MHELRPRNSALSELARIRYDADSANYLEFADSERTVLRQERLKAQIKGQRFIAAVRLIKAL